MARFDVCANPFASERAYTPLLLDVQNDHLGLLARRVVMALRSPEGCGTPARRLNPRIDVQRMAVVVVDTASLAPVPTRLLSQSVQRGDAARNDSSTPSTPSTSPTPLTPC